MGLAALAGLESQCQDAQCLPGEEVLYVQHWAEVLPVWDLQGNVWLGGKVWARSTQPERKKGKDRKGESLSVAREENVKDGQLAGSMHRLGGEQAGRGEVSLWFSYPSPMG